MFVATWMGAGVEEALSNHERDELATWFTEEDVARQVLDAIGFRRAQQPPWQAAHIFWNDVDRELRAGILADGRRQLLAAAAKLYPYNQVFAGGRATGGAVPPAPRRWVPDGDDPVILTVLMVDAVGFSKQIATTQLDWRKTIYGVTSKALKAAGIPADFMVRREDRGDGYLALLDVSVPLTRIVADFVRELVTALHAHNSLRNADGRVRLRVAVNQGIVVFDDTAFTSEAVIAAARLCDAEAVRKALRDEPAADVAFVISDKAFRDTVAEQFRGLDKANFERIQVHGDKYEGVGWMQVDGRRPTPTADTEATSAAAEPPGSVEVAANDDEAPENDDAAAGESGGWDFFVSYAKEDEEWAAWVIGVLEKARYMVHAMYLYDVGGAAKHMVVQEGMRNAKRTIAILTPAYLRSPYVDTQWSYAWRSDPQGVKRKLVPVRVEKCKPDGFLQGITAINLVGMDQSVAAEHLVEEVRASLSGRRARKSGPPTFPPTAAPPSAGVEAEHS